MTVGAERAAVRGAVRRSARAARRALDPIERARSSEIICAHIASSVEWVSASTVTLFVPMIDEVDVWPLLRRGCADGKAMAIPRIVDRAGGIMTFDRLACENVSEAGNGWADELVDGLFGISQARHPDEVGSEEIDLVVVPAIALDENGDRLGGGAGYYDRWLAAARRNPARQPSALGAVFAVQVLAAGSFPVEPHDQRLDAFVTELGLHRCPGQTAGPATGRSLGA